MKDLIRTGRDPTTVIFDITNDPNAVQNLILGQATFHNWNEKAAEKARTAKRKQFDSKMKWIDWRDSLVNFLRTQPGRNGVPLIYIIRDNDQPIVQNNAQFLDDYVDQAPLNGSAFSADAGEVHTYLVNFITENSTAENKILPFQSEKNRRTDYFALKDHYEGVGANAS